MGRATRWLRNLFTSKKENSVIAVSSERREKKRWSFKTPRDSCEPEKATAAWLRSFYAESEMEQNKKAIAVAAASAAAADAAVAAAQAAVAVVHLTSHSRRTKLGGFHEWFAAVKIQRVFRGYLAKKALRALKALVKLQALVRGYLVRKKTAATFHSMQALIKAQETIRAEKCRALLSSSRKFHHEEFPRISLDTSSFHNRKLSTSLDNPNCVSDSSPKVVQMDSFRLKSKPYRRSTYLSIDHSDEISPNSFSSPLPNIGKISISDCRSSFEKCRYSTTAQSTPRCIAPTTPTKSVCGVTATNCPNYMNNTQCFEAKVRSQSTPKQRPELLMGSSRRIPLSELIIEQSRASLSSVKMKKAEEEFSFKRADGERDFYLQNKW